MYEIAPFAHRAAQPAPPARRAAAWRSAGATCSRKVRSGAPFGAQLLDRPRHHGGRRRGLAQAPKQGL
ncbi:hypothetical protein, partial [Bordetella pertussis]|uniref:hypothetical protein n=1 Tax=Bordetella pertussis TaxID=520 RepID=UPI001C9E7753